MASGKRTGVGKVIGRALTGPLNLSILGGAVLGAVAIASWPIAAIGGAAYAALVASDVSNVDFRRKILFGRAAPGKLPKPDTFSDAAVRKAVESIVRARTEVDAVVKGMPERVKRSIASTLKSLDELEGHGAGLAQRAEELAKYLQSVDLDAIAADARELAERAEDSTDPGARDDYKQAATAALDRQKAMRDIAAARERTIAHLARIASTVKGSPRSSYGSARSTIRRRTR